MIQFILDQTGAKSCEERELVQSLWSGYGSIKRFDLYGANVDSIIVKHIDLNQSNAHPRGWATDKSHLRKVKSYEVESEWYTKWYHRCDDLCRIPNCYGTKQLENGQIILLEDLNAVGYDKRKSTLNELDINKCLEWLAFFHARFIHEKPEGLWDIGTYWHLNTRPDEWEVMETGILKDYAQAIDKALNEARFQTMVHGDAKVANFCFTSEKDTNLKGVAAVDFQYVGAGCGMKDVAYFLGSCLDEVEMQKKEHEYVNYYFSRLQVAVATQKTLNLKDFETLQAEWRRLYNYAVADFERFLAGWMPTHFKLNRYTKKITKEVINELKKK